MWFANGVLIAILIHHNTMHAFNPFLDRIIGAQSTGFVNSRCICRALYKPVCDNNGTTHKSACEAQCKNKASVNLILALFAVAWSIIYFQVIQCQSSCPCPVLTTTESDKVISDIETQSCISQHCSKATLDPVCALNGATYESDCHARCAGQRRQCRGRCPCSLLSGSDPTAVSDSSSSGQLRPCRCNLVEEQVCGTNGETYTNECFASCKEVRLKCRRRCPC